MKLSHNTDLDLKKMIRKESVRIIYCLEILLNSNCIGSCGGNWSYLMEGLILHIIIMSF